MALVIAFHKYPRIMMAPAATAASLAAARDRQRWSGGITDKDQAEHST